MEIKEKLNLNEEDYSFSFDREFSKYLFIMSQITNLCNEAERILKRINDNLNIQIEETSQDDTSELNTGEN